MNYKFLVFTVFFFTSLHARFLVMLSPAGDALNPGRMPELSLQSCERGITRQLAESLKAELEASDPSIECLITHNAGQTAGPLSHATLANQLNVDLFLTLHIVAQGSPKPLIALYQYSNNALRDKAGAHKASERVLPINEAHRPNFHKTQSYASTLYKHLSLPTYEKLFKIKPPKSCQLLPLLGIKPPALLAEISIKHDDDWKTLLAPLQDALCSLNNSQN